MTFLFQWLWRSDNYTWHSRCISRFQRMYFHISYLSRFTARVSTFPFMNTLYISSDMTYVDTGAMTLRSFILALPIGITNQSNQPWLARGMTSWLTDVGRVIPKMPLVAIGSDDLPSGMLLLLIDEHCSTTEDDLCFLSFISRDSMKSVATGAILKDCPTFDNRDM